MKMASTHGTAQASAAGGLAASSTLEGAGLLYPLTRIATIISACGYEPDTAETALQSAQPDAIAVECYPFRIQTFHDGLSEGLALAACRKTYRFDTDGYNDCPQEQGRYPHGVRRVVQ
jgi:hypothetical protein